MPAPTQECGPGQELKQVPVQAEPGKRRFELRCEQKAPPSGYPDGHQDITMRDGRSENDGMKRRARPIGNLLKRVVLLPLFLMLAGCVTYEGVDQNGRRSKFGTLIECRQSSIACRRVPQNPKNNASDTYMLFPKK